MDQPSGSPQGEKVRYDALLPGAPGCHPDQTGKLRYERRAPYQIACRTFPGYSRPSRNWPEKDRPLLRRLSNRVSGCAPWKSSYSRDTEGEAGAGLAGFESFIVAESTGMMGYLR